MTTVAIPFVRIDASQNPNLELRIGEDPAEPYFKAMTVAFASLRRWQPNVKLEFISNAEPPSAHRNNFDRLGVLCKRVPFMHNPPSGFADHFVGSLYLLDALRSLTAEQNILIDPDVLCVDGLDAMLDDLGTSVGVLTMNFPPDKDINGISRRQAGELHGLLGEPEVSPVHFGGEVYVIPKLYLEQIRERCDQAWKLTLDRHSLGLPKFTTEEHILSFALRALPRKDLDGHVRRIWTAHRYRVVNGDESKLTLWHLPAEKDRGFEALFPIVLDDRSWFWHADRDEFIKRAGRAMGLHHRSFPRWAKDCLGYAIRVMTLALAQSWRRT